MADNPQVSTPEPVLKAFGAWGSLATLVVTAVGVLVSVGVLSSQDAATLTSTLDYVNAHFVEVGTAVVGIVSVVSGLVSGVVTAVTARSKVVPVDSDAYVITPVDQQVGR